MAVDVGESGAVRVVVDLLLETFLVALAGDAVEGAPYISPAASTVSFTAATNPSLTVAASTVALLLPMPFSPVVLGLSLSLLCRHSFL